MLIVAIVAVATVDPMVSIVTGIVSIRAASFPSGEHDTFASAETVADG
jgi:hypothetical protein